jgi:hypothetical protein
MDPLLIGSSLNKKTYRSIYEKRRRDFLLLNGYFINRKRGFAGKHKNYHYYDFLGIGHL